MPIVKKTPLVIYTGDTIEIMAFGLKKPLKYLCTSTIQYNGEVYEANLKSCKFGSIKRQNISIFKRPKS